MRSFIVVVDTQWDFMAPDGALPVPGASSLIAPMNAWLRRRRPADTAGILFTFDTHSEQLYRGSPEAEQFPIHCVKGTSGWENVLDTGAIDPAIPLYALQKGVFAMWAEADVVIGDLRNPGAAAVGRDAFFERLKQDGVDQVIVIGVAADYCVRWAIEGLVERGFRVCVPEDLTRGIQRQIREVVADDFSDAPVMLAGHE